MKSLKVEEMVSIMAGLHKSVAKRKCTFEGEASSSTTSLSEKRRKYEVLIREEVSSSLAIVLSSDVADEAKNCTLRRLRYLEALQRMGIDKNSTSFIDSQSGLNSFAYKNWPQLQMCREHRQTNEANFAASTALASPASGSAPRVFDMRTVGNSLQWEERLPLSVRSAAASSSGLQTLRRPAPGILRVVENALPFLDDNCLKVTVPSSGRSATRPVSRRQMLLEEAADAVAGQFSSAQQAEREVLQVLARRLEALTDATLHAVMESAAATATVGSATAGGTTLGWQHVLRELQLPLRWPDSLPSAESMLSEQLLQRVARRLDVIFCSKKV